MNRPSYRTTAKGVRQVLNADVYAINHPGADIATCGTCGRSWDDSHVTGLDTGA
jgi:hypothetical protein